MRPTRLPPGATFPHGSRGGYTFGCRCAACRAANARYSADYRARYHKEQADPFVEAAPIQAHIRELARQGIGYPSVAAAASMQKKQVWKIRVGITRHVRESTARRLLAVDAGAASDHSLIDARPTWRLIRALRVNGYTLLEIAARLGNSAPHLQIGEKLIHARTAYRIRKLHAELMREAEMERDGALVCRLCGFSHATEDRLAVLRRMLPCDTEALREAHPCWWGGGDGSAGDRRMYRDLKIVGADRKDGQWRIPEVPWRVAV